MLSDQSVRPSRSLRNVAALTASADVLQGELGLVGQRACFSESCWESECSLNKVLSTYFHSNRQEGGGKRPLQVLTGQRRRPLVFAVRVSAADSPGRIRASARLADLDPISDCPNLHYGLCWISRRPACLLFSPRWSTDLPFCPLFSLAVRRHWRPSAPRHELPFR